MDRAVENAFNGLFAIVEAQQKSLEWITRDIGDKCQRALPDLRRARELIDAVKAVAKAHDDITLGGER